MLSLSLCVLQSVPTGMQQSGEALHDPVGMLQALPTAGHVWVLQGCQLPARSSVATRAAAVKL